MSETATLMCVGIAGQFARTLSLTNPCRSMIEIVRHANKRETLAGRRRAQALDRGREAQFRMIIGYSDLARLCSRSSAANSPSKAVTLRPSTPVSPWRCDRSGPKWLWLNGERIACGRGQPDRVEVRDREGYVPVRFNHLAIAAKDKQHSAAFLKDLLGLDEPTSWGPFLSLTLDDGVRLDYAEPGIEFPGQHYALLVSDDVFDRAVERIKADGVQFWAGPGHTPGEINTNHGGRGVYFDDPAGHHFELITQPYGVDM